MEWENPYTKEEMEKFFDLYQLQELIREYENIIWKAISAIQPRSR